MLRVARLLSASSGYLVPVLPEQLAGGRVEGLDDVAGARQEHHAVVDERRGLVGALGHRQRPGQAQAGHVVGPDPVQRRVALVVAGAPPGQPVLRRRIPEQLVGDRGQAGDLAVDERAAGRHGVHVAGLVRRRRVGRIRRGAGAPCRRGAGLADDGRSVRGERLRSRRMAVHLQQVGDDAQAGSARERSAEPRRHLGPHVPVAAFGRRTGRRLWRSGRWTWCPRPGKSCSSPGVARLQAFGSPAPWCRSGPHVGDSNCPAHPVPAGHRIRWECVHPSANHTPRSGAVSLQRPPSA